ncbi:hypothetical protein B0H10DRAFT_1713306, partial [Mycena sp. CBHHK59/15]
VKGYLLGAFPATRDVFHHGGRLIISHAGGKGERNQKTTDASVRALLENHRSGCPVLLLVDDRYELFPFDLGSHDVYMAVLGFYSIVHVWAEYEASTTGRVVRRKFAFQWCEDQGQPWWI